jgi:hypothetical protein
VEAVKRVVVEDGAGVVVVRDGRKVYRITISYRDLLALGPRLSLAAWKVRRGEESDCPEGLTPGEALEGS